MSDVGAYGKMPGLGDFFRLRLPGGFCTPWDAWVQATLQATRRTLGAQWEGCYMSAPIWRFALAPGLAGPEAAAGVLMPSVDRVGRAFPLTLACLGATPDFDPLEEIALSALDDSMTKDRLAEALAGVETSGAEPLPMTGSIWRAQLEGEEISFKATALPEGADALRLFDPLPSEVRA